MFFLDILLSFVSSVILIICVLVSVAFLTLLERKVLGYIQVRKGPNKVGVVGILQPFSDAVKLFSKEQTYPLFSNFLIYFLSPVVSLFLSLLVWVVLPLGVTCNSFSLGVLFFLGCISMGVYSIAIAGWSSNSNYAVLGGLRAVAQTISYEVSLVFIILSLILLTGSLDFSFFLSYQKYVPFCLFLFPLCFIWFIVMLAETNRTPFDLAEGESELVSGFNVEYSSGGFAMIFLAEYSSILFMSVLFCIMFFSSWMFSISFYMLVVLISFLFIWSRATLPRVRYDKLMGLTWKCFLPFSLNFLLLIIGVKIMLFYYILWT